MLRLACCLLILLALPAAAQDTTVGDGSTNGDLNTNMGDGNVVDSNNVTEAVTNNYNAGTPGPFSNPVPSAVAPTVMGGGGSESCLIPSSNGVQISLLGVAQGRAEQDPECNRRRDARLLGAPQAAGGLGLQVSGISVMCAAPHVFRAMALASTPCPIFDVNRNQLLTGREAFEMMRSDPATYVVGYAQDPAFWNAFLRMGENLDEVESITRVPISQRFRTGTRGRDDDQSGSGGERNRGAAGAGQ